MIFLEKKYSAAEYRSLVEARGDGQCTDSDRQEGGRFGDGNDCQKEGSGSGDSVATVAKKAKERNVDVMLGGGKRVAVMDAESRQRAIDDFKSHPKPAGAAAGSSTDLWDREFVTREKGRVQKPKDGSEPRVSDGKIASTAPAFTSDDLRQNSQFVAHEAVGQFLSSRHEEERAKTGASGPGAIIDTAAEEIPEQQMKYVVDALAEDAIHAYDVLGVDPGFYSTDLGSTMRQMTTRHPEFASDDNARFVFTTLLAITSSGQGPDANLRDADDLYRMYREHGTVVPSSYGGGGRSAIPSLKAFQGLLDSFGPDRTRRLLSGYTTAGRIEKTLRSLAGKSKADEWRERTGSSPWSVPVDDKGKEKEMTSGELRDEVIPIAAIFGPKIGSFYANLSGRHEFLTMDRWLMRSVGRVTGELITRSTPKAAKERAKAALAALESRSWSKSYLFGIDKSHGITKADLIRSLKIQERTGVIEENGAAFVWATAAERSHQKTPRASGGGYGTHPDPAIHSMHQAGNSLFKSLILEQQDPKTGTARRNIREIFRRVQSEVESRTGRKADIDEIQAALWQYEKRLWKHLGAKTNITDNSLFSAAAEGVISGRLKREKPFQPASRRSSPQGEDEDESGDDFDTGAFDVEQSAWESNLADLGIDLLDLLSAIEEDVEERANFAALDVEQRAGLDCGRQEGGRFGPKNMCAADDGGANVTGGGATATATAPSTRWQSSNRGIVKWSGSSIAKDNPISGGEKLRSVEIRRPKELAKAMGDVLPESATLDDVVAIGGGAVRGSDLMVTGVGDTISTQMTTPVDPSEPDGWRVYSDVHMSGADGVITAVDYGLLEIYPPGADGDDPFYDPPSPNDAVVSRITSMMMERMTDSLMTAERLGAEQATTTAIGSGHSDDQWKGYRLWPQFGFDGPITRRTVNLIEDEPDLTFLSDEARDKWDAGEQLTVQDIIATREGRLWWDENGSSTDMSFDFSDKSSKGYQQFERMKRLLPKLRERNKSRSWIEEAESRNCAREATGQFAEGNDCQEKGTGTAESQDSWREDGGTVLWDSERPPVRGELASLEVQGGRDVAKAMESVGVDSLDKVVSLGGGTARGAEVRVSAYGTHTVAVSTRIPIDPQAQQSDDPYEGAVTSSVMISRGRDGKSTLHYGSLYTPMSVSSASATKEDRLRIASLLKEHFLESLSTAEAVGISSANMAAAGDAEDKYLQGYRLWPQFGFDGEVPNLSEVPDEIVLKAAGIDIPPAGSTRIPHATVIRSLRSRVRSLTVQQLISVREGDRWWDENGTDVSLSLDLTDKTSLGYKRYQQAKKSLARLKERNKSRDWLDWLDDLESRDADCGRDESGKFGSGNDCAKDGSGSASPKESAKSSPKEIKAGDPSLKNHQPPPPAPRTGTPEFKAWFGDSKVVDESGAPSVVYHGTTSGWTEFDESKSHDIGFHAGTREQAVRKAGENQGSNVMPVFLSIERPIRLSDHAWDTPDTIVSSLPKAGIRVDETLASKHKDWQEKEAKRLDRSLEYDDSLSYDDYKAIKSKQYDDARAARREVMAAAKAAIKKAGYDGVVYKNEVEGAGDSWIAFDASQIKSASGNSGKFDKTNKSIVRSLVARSSDCGRDESGRFGGGNDCAKDGGSESPKESAKSFPKEITAGDPSLKKYVPFRPVADTKNSDFARPADDESLRAAIGAAKGARFADKYGAPRELPQGSPVAIRIDVPTFKKSGAYAVTVHKATKGGFDPSPVGYDSVARLDGPVVFESKENDAVLVAAGLSQKFPLATVKGSLSKDRSIPDDIDDWTAVGYDPQKAAYFYDKRTGDEVTGGTDSISVGNSVFVRKPTYATNPRNAARQYRNAGFWGLESRDADCGRDEGGRFGTGNKCQEDAGSPTAEKVTWSAGSGEPPFEGAEKAASISVSGNKEVTDSLDTLGVDKSSIVDLAGAAGGSVFVRPAPDLTTKLPGGVLPVLISWDRPFGGVDYGIEGSSAVGRNDKGESILYHSTVTVDPRAKDTPAKRHAAATAFYTMMAESVQAARKAGISEVRFNASGSKVDKSWKGYTIWPRMGFDAPLPDDIKSKLPETLSHAKSLLDLHATREGTQWWSENGREVDVTFRLDDPSSPQARIMSRFIKRFSTNRRDMPLGAGDGWLSPADLARFDELWQEIWDEGDLDEYEYGKA